jgi:hypothetical protein
MKTQAERDDRLTDVDTKIRCVRGNVKEAARFGPRNRASAAGSGTEERPDTNEETTHSLGLELRCPAFLRAPLEGPRVASRSIVLVFRSR